MAPNLSEEEIDDLIYLARVGEDAELMQLLKELAERENVTVADVLEAAKDEGKATCLHMAAANGHSRTVTHILSHLSSSTAPLPSSTSASTAEDSTSSQPPVSYINLANNYGNTALHWACLGGHLDTIQLLLSRGASPALANDKDQIPLDLAAFNQHMDVVEYFLSQSREKEAENAKDGGLGGGMEDVKMEEGEVEAESEQESGPAASSA